MARPRIHATPAAANAAAHRAYNARRIAAGAKRITMIIPPEAVRDLEAIRARDGIESDTAAVVAALKIAAAS